MVWSLALRSDDAKQDPVVYGTKFGVVFLAEGPRTASIQKGLGPTDRFSSPTEKKIAKTIIRICPFRQILSCSELAN